MQTLDYCPRAEVPVFSMADQGLEADLFVAVSGLMPKL